MKSITQFFFRNIFVALFVLIASEGILPSTVQAASAATTAAIQPYQMTLGTGRVVYFEMAKPTQAGYPTFLLLPGVNRAFLLSEPGPQALIAKGYGVVGMNFSVHPFSVNALPANEVPFFMSASPSLQDFANEVSQLAKTLQTQFQTGPVIPVSLSYTGAVSPLLKDFPVVIETVPMTSAAAENPQLEAYRQSLKAGEMWNPIFGPGITRSLLDTAYRSEWEKQVSSMAEQFNFSEDRHSQMVEGYTTLSRAVEGFEWDLSALPKNVNRVFIFAENESKSLLTHQVATFETLYGKDAKTLLFVVKNAGHVVPSDQPEAYASILDLVAQGKTKAMGGVVEVDSASRKSRTFTGAQVHTYLQSLIDANQN